MANVVTTCWACSDGTWNFNVPTPMFILNNHNIRKLFMFGIKPRRLLAVVLGRRSKMPWYCPSVLLLCQVLGRSVEQGPAEKTEWSQWCSFTWQNTLTDFTASKYPTTGSPYLLYLASKDSPNDKESIRLSKYPTKNCHFHWHYAAVPKDQALQTSSQFRAVWAAFSSNILLITARGSPC